jgi:D-arabinose 1-dehydrogenase-like Zn-dependent alcohol dehydrogenase
MPGLVPGIHVLTVERQPRTWIAGHRLAEATPSFGRLCPAMTRWKSPRVLGEFIVATFKAIRIDKAEKGTTAALTQFDEAELMDGDVTVRVEWSTLNYKDGLAVTGKAPVVRRFPMIAGIDFAGTVEQSTHPQWKAGDKVVCNGWGMGETHLGAYAEKARVKGDWLVRLPDSISTRDAMAIGTAGYTAMLSVLAASARSRPRCCQNSAITSLPPPGGRRKRIT